MIRPGIQPAMGVAAFRFPDAIAKRLPPRSIRVLSLLAVIVALSVIDLALTLIYMTEIGLIEQNPVARFAVQIGGPWALAATKFASVATCVGILYATRRRGCAELGAWFGMGVLVWLTIRWLGYMQAFATVGATTMAELEHHGQGAWVTLAEVGSETVVD